MDRGATLSLALFALALFGCRTPEVCEPHRLPNRGVADTPESLAAIATYSVANDCLHVLRGVLDAKTRGEVGTLKLWIALDTDLEPLGWPAGLTPRKLLGEAKYEGWGVDPRGDRYLVFTWRRDLKPIYLVPEVPEGRCPLVTPPEWRLDLTK